MITAIIMEISKPVMSVLVVSVILGVYFILIAIFKNFFRTCYRIGKTFVWRSFLYGIIVEAVLIGFSFAAVFMAKGLHFEVVTIAIPIAVLTFIGSAAGLILLGSLFNIIDGEKRPYSALAVGIIIVGVAGVFDWIGGIINKLIGIYGLGTMVLYFKGERAETLEQMGEVSRFNDTVPSTGGAPAGDSNRENIPKS